MAQLLKCFSLVYIIVHTMHGQVQFKLLKTKGEFLEDVSGLSYKCKTITFSETSIVECSAKCYDPKSVKWRDSEFNCKTDSDPEMSLSGLYCKYFTFTRGQYSLCLRSNGFDPTSVQIPSDDDYIGLNTGNFRFYNLSSSSASASSLYDSNHPASKMIDNHAGSSSDTCTVSQGVQPYFRLDLTTAVTFWGVELLSSRHDSHDNQLANFTIYASNDPTSFNSEANLCHVSTREGSGRGNWMRLLCKKVFTSKYVFIQADAKEDTSNQELTISEIKILQPDLSSHYVDLSKATVTLVNLHDVHRPGSFLIDGLSLTAEKCVPVQDTVTMQPAFIVDMKGSVFVHAVEIMARSDCCANQLLRFTVYITDEPLADPTKVCFTETGTVGLGVMRKLQCTTDLTGRYVIIQANEPTTRILTICEMRVLQKDTT